jgi:hypothetical protein
MLLNNQRYLLVLILFELHSESCHRLQEKKRKIQKRIMQVAVEIASQE